jgi:DHA2 family multidrug resistance protein
VTAHVQANASAEDWLAVAAGALGALMATLDISITNSALPQIQGAVGATGTEGTWISTGYLMSEIVMIPLAAWLSRVLGMRNFLLVNAALFVGFSMMCGLSGSLPMLIIARIGQGFTGGALIPTAQTIIRTRLPQHQMPIGMTMFGLIVLLGPLLGPVFGGWLTENADWSWCFFINVPVCALLLGLLLFGLPAERMQPGEFIKADWLGIVGLSLGLSTLTVVLEEGQRERWFESDMIIRLSIASCIGLILVAVSQWRSPKPIMRLSLLRNKSYASVILIVFAVGAGLYGVSYLVPQFLSLVSGYNAEQSGAVMLLVGIPAFLIMPLLPAMVTRYDYRVLVIAGLLCFAGSCLLDTGLTAQSVGSDFTWSQLLRGIGQMLCMMPLNQASMAAVRKEESGDAAGLYNMARNLGGSVGLAVLGTFIDRREALHTSLLRQAVPANSELVQQRMADMTAGQLAVTGDAAHASLRALGQLSLQINQQSVVMTFAETFQALAVVLLCCIPLALLLKTPKPGSAPLDSGH